MNKFYSFLPAFFLQLVFCFFHAFSFAQSPQDLVIGAAIKPIPGKDTVLLSWPQQSSGGIFIYEINNGNFNFLKSVPAPDTSTKIYVKRGGMRQLKLYNTANVNKLQLLCASNYFVKTPELRTVLLLVTPSINSGAAFHVKQWVTNAENEGWTVKKYVINEALSPEVVKDTIIYFYNSANGSSLKGIFLLGHIPVPYSGQINPDGHLNHIGAWPADGYYVDFGATYYTDNIVNTDSSANPPSRQANRNIPGDGKFDASILSSGVEFWVGRVDFNNLPVFTGVNPNYTELFLIKRYLEKNNAFRNNLIRPDIKTIIDDNFGYFSGEAFAANGWMVGKQFMHDSLIQTTDFFNSTTNQSFLWGYGCGGGSYTSAGGIGNTNDFATDSVNIVFSMLFGSYFGDWDSKNNFMRSALASKGMILTCAWAGRPDWYFHHMAANFPIGKSVKVSLNATNSYSSAYAHKWVHMGLMGDPTLRVHSVKPPNNLIVSGSLSTQSLSWTPSTDTSVSGYFVFRKQHPDSSYRLLNLMPIQGANYTDTNALPGQNYYAVAAGQLIENMSGKHYAISKSIFAIGTNTVDIKSINISNNAIIYPNPSISQATLKLPDTFKGNSQIYISNIKGKRIKALHTFGKTKLQLPNLPAGIYLVQIDNKKAMQIITKKWIILK